jgi:UDP-N-acetylmuramoyl-tripeptide--D-alanyl-D-alanine ligase
MGMNHLGEIEPLSKLARPHLSLITTVGPVHIEFFKNEQEIALAKSEIFAGLVEDGFALLNCDNHHFSYLQERCKAWNIKPENTLTFGKKDGSNYQILHSSVNDSSSALVEAKLKNGTKFYYEISSSNPTTILNSIIAVACLEVLGNDFVAGVNELKNLKTFNGRGNFKEVICAGKKISIIDDTYNASILSMKAGINHAVDLKKSLGKQRVIIALGDMLELGNESAEIHQETLKYLATQDFDLCILVGEEMKKAAAFLPENSYKTFATSEAASLEIKDLLQDQDLIYLKGSRGIKMEKIIEKIS